MPEKSYQGNSKKRGNGTGKDDSESSKRSHKNKSFDGCNPHRLVRVRKNVDVDGINCDVYECRNCPYFTYYPVG